MMLQRITAGLGGWKRLSSGSASSFLSLLPFQDPVQSQRRSCFSSCAKSNFILSNAPSSRTSQPTSWNQALRWISLTQNDGPQLESQHQNQGPNNRNNKHPDTFDDQGSVDPKILRECKEELDQIRERFKSPPQDFYPEKELQRIIEIMEEHSTSTKVMRKWAFETLHTAFNRLGFAPRVLEITKQLEETFEILRHHSEAKRFTPAQITLLSRCQTLLKGRIERYRELSSLSSDQRVRSKGKTKTDLIALKIDPNDTEQVDPETAPRRLRLAERVLLSRTSRIAIVLEKCYDSLNHQAVLRTAECFGVQHVYIVMSPNWKPLKLDLSHRLTRGCEKFLTIHRFSTTQECINQLRLDGREIWATDLSQSSVSLKDHSSLQLPEKMALVIGRETDGVSQEMLEAADKRVFLPMYGFSESLNLSVATALIIQQLFFICPEALGSMEEQERSNIRALWYGLLSS